MRLTCPNCNAVYEVADSMIPPEGRDVQCSNCQSTWFQPGRAGMPDEIEGGMREVPTARPVSQPRSEPGEDETPPAPDPAPDLELPPAPPPDPETQAGPDAEDLPSLESDADEMPRRRLDPELQAMLQEERARTEAARSGEAGLETQADLDLPQPQPDPQPAAAPAPIPEPEVVPGGLAPDPRGRPGGSRRDLLPDIEQINSTLRATGDRRPGQADGTDVETSTRVPRQRAGFRIGFTAMIVLAIVLGAVYLQAPRIAGWLPPSEPVLDAYVGAVDAARLWLDEVVRGGAGQLTRSLGGGDG